MHRPQDAACHAEMAAPPPPALFLNAWAQKSCMPYRVACPPVPPRCAPCMALKSLHAMQRWLRHLPRRHLQLVLGGHPGWGRRRAGGPTMSCQACWLRKPTRWLGSRSSTMSRLRPASPACTGGSTVSKAVRALPAPACAPI